MFLRAWLRAPLSVASILPSSVAMGRAFAAVIDAKRPGDILELGSGTGAITQGLLAGGIDGERLILVERDDALADYLAASFADLRLLRGDAVEVGAMLDAAGVRCLAAVVSTLPIVWFPVAVQAAILAACFDRLGAGGAFLQMTNQPASPLPMRKLGLNGERAATIWRNFPPSFIWRYRRD